MTFDVIVRLPVPVPYGTDEDFDLRVLLEGELSSTLGKLGIKQSVFGEIDSSHLNFHIDGISDAIGALFAAKEVLTRHGLLDRSIVVLETPNQDDPDERNSVVLWSAPDAGASHVV